MKSYFESIGEIIRTGHWFTDSITKELKEYGIYEPQYNVMRILYVAKGEPVSVNTILEGMMQPSSNVTRIVDKLSSKGLVSRTLSEKDRRKMDIVLTIEGKKLLEKLDEKVHAFHRPMMKNLTSSEAKTLKDLILKLKGS